MELAAPPISAVVITRNAEHCLARTLQALDWCDEIVVVDSRSTDRTEDICRQHHCRFSQRAFDGFGPQKHYAVTCAKNDWVFVVDADEVVSAELRDEIRAELASPDQLRAGYRVPISLIFLGRTIRFGGEYGKRHLRLFNRTTGNFSLDAIHERVVVHGPIRDLKGHIWHHSYRDLTHFFEKFNQYTTASARAMFARGRRTSRWRAAWRFPRAFLWLYFVRGLIWDGCPGFAWALFSALYRMVKCLKLYELQQGAAAGEPPGLPQQGPNPGSPSRKVRTG